MNAINEEPEASGDRSSAAVARGRDAEPPRHPSRGASAGRYWPGNMIWSARSLPVFTEAAQRPELGMPQLPAGQPPVAYH